MYLENVPVVVNIGVILKNMVLPESHMQIGYIPGDFLPSFNMLSISGDESEIRASRYMSC